MSVFVPGWFEDYDPHEVRRWTVAAAVVVAAHAALITGYLLWRPAPEAIGGDSDIVTVDLAPIDTMTDAKQLDVAPSPEEMVEQRPTPPQVEKQPDQPKVEEQPAPPDVTSDVTLPMEQKPIEKVEEQRPPAPRTMAPVKGGAPPVEPSWETELVRHLQQFKNYPEQARARSEQGVVLLAFSVDRSGHVIARQIAQSSGHPDLDNEVMAMIDRAQPLPAFPPSMTEAQLSLTVPIRFSLR